MRFRSSLFAVFAILFVGSLSNAQCLNCQSVMVEHVHVPTIQYETPVFQAYGPQVYEVQTRAITPQELSAQCIGAAIDAFVRCKAANPESNFFACLPAAFGAYAQCSGQSRLSVRDVFRVKQAIKAHIAQNRAPRQRVRLLRR